MCHVQFDGPLILSQPVGNLPQGRYVWRLVRFRTDVDSDPIKSWKLSTVDLTDDGMDPVHADQLCNT